MPSCWHVITTEPYQLQNGYTDQLANV